MNNETYKKVVRRSTSEYLNTIVGLFFVLAMLYQSIVSFSYVMFVWLILMVFDAGNIVLMHYRPLIKINAEYLIIYPYVFKKIAIRINEIKCFRLYNVINKMILTQQQAKQNNTLIIDLVDGESITIQVRLLSKAVRQNIITLAKEHNISLEYQMPSEVVGGRETQELEAKQSTIAALPKIEKAWRGMYRSFFVILIVFPAILAFGIDSPFAMVSLFIHVLSLLVFCIYLWTLAKALNKSPIVWVLLSVFVPLLLGILITLYRMRDFVHRTRMSVVVTNNP
jgi:hypothetical protein